MIDLEFDFEESRWQLALKNYNCADKISAAQLLTLLEDAEESQVEEALDTLLEKQISLDISDLPKFSASGASATRLMLEEKLVRMDQLEDGLEENDPLRLYLQELSQNPRTGTLIDEMLPHAVSCAREYVGKGVLLLDLIQEASLGLLQATERLDGKEDCLWYMHQFLARAVFMQARACGVGQRLRQALEDYRAVDEKLLTELGRNPTIEEIAEAMHICVQEAGLVAETLDSVMLLNRVHKPEPEEIPQEEDQAVEDTAYFQMRQRISELLSVLPEEDAKLLQLRYGLEGGLPMKPEQVAAKLGLTKDEVISREAAALAKMRQQ
ncbi:MAG: sigma-70 family RNA polymerase sigma factor [Oscillospiraceae bacterium]|nr:sigma-70 family RNA polymerase sigma factor [Oscillospiraceae bacterium]